MLLVLTGSAPVCSGLSDNNHLMWVCGFKALLSFHQIKKNHLSRGSSVLVINFTTHSLNWFLIQTVLVCLM